MTYHEECHEDIHHTCEQLTVTPVPYKPAYVSPSPTPSPYSITPVPYKPGHASPTPAKYNLADSKPPPSPYPQQYKSPAPKHFPSLTAHLPLKRQPPHQSHHNPTGPTLTPNHLHSRTTVTPRPPHQVHTFTTAPSPHFFHSPTATPHTPHPPHLLPHHHHQSHFQSTTPFPSMFSPSTAQSPTMRNFPSPTTRPSPVAAPESSTIQDSFFPSVPRHATATPLSFRASTTLSPSQFFPPGPSNPKRLDNFPAPLDEKRADIVNQFNSLLSRQKREGRASADPASLAQFQPFLPRNHLNQHHFLNPLPLSAPTSFSPTSAVPTSFPQLKLASSGNSLFEVKLTA